MSDSHSPEPYRQVTPVPPKPGPAVDEKSLQAKCAQTGHLFKVTLQRPAGKGARFKVSGITPVSDKAVTPYVAPNSLFTLILQALGRFLNRYSGPVARPQPADEQEGGEVIYLGIGDINWNGHKCPDCASQAPAPDGGTYTWLQCGTCGNISCVGNLNAKNGWFVCPWCRTRGHLRTAPKQVEGPRRKLLARAESRRPDGGPKALPPGDQGPRQLPPPK